MRLPACAGSMDHLAALAVEVGEVDRAPELRQRARLDLADPLARDAEMLAGLLERAGDAVVETVADAPDPRLPRPAPPAGGGGGGGGGAPVAGAGARPGPPPTSAARRCPRRRVPRTRPR